jgi:hypothetical protein
MPVRYTGSKNRSMWSYSTSVVLDSILMMRIQTTSVRRHLLSMFSELHVFLRKNLQCQYVQQALLNLQQCKSLQFFFNRAGFPFFKEPLHFDATSVVEPEQYSMRLRLRYLHSTWIDLKNDTNWNIFLKFSFIFAQNYDHITKRT